MYAANRNIRTRSYKQQQQLCSPTGTDHTDTSTHITGTTTDGINSTDNGLQWKSTAVLLVLSSVGTDGTGILVDAIHQYMIRDVSYYPPRVI